MVPFCLPQLTLFLVRFFVRFLTLLPSYPFDPLTLLPFYPLTFILFDLLMICFVCLWYRSVYHSLPLFWCAFWCAFRPSYPLTLLTLLPSYPFTLLPFRPLFICCVFLVRFGPSYPLTLLPFYPLTFPPTLLCSVEGV